ncbi:MAG: tetratricopeptide repeat protein, partial [Planctomycetota bacterium]
MKTLLLLSLLALGPGGERERGLQLYREGRFAEAAAAFQKALDEDGDSAELQWNLALAAWRAGDLTTAETAAEKYAALDRNARVDLHAGLLGAV